MIYGSGEKGRMESTYGLAIAQWATGLHFSYALPGECVEQSQN